MTSPGRYAGIEEEIEAHRAALSTHQAHGVSFEAAAASCYDTTYLRNYALLNVKDRLARIDGVGQVQLFGGGDYAMRLWLDPQKVAERGLSASDVVREIRAQNVQAAAGVIGASPGEPGIDLQLSINAQGRLQSEEEFADIVVKSGANGEVTRLRDIARIELGAADYELRSLLDN